MNQWPVALLCACMAAVALPVVAQQKPPSGSEVRVPSTPGNVIRGHIPANLPPIMRVKPGQLVTIDTLSHQGVNTGDDPIAFFARGGIKSEEVLKDHVDIYGRVKPPPGGGTHVLTGPIYVEGAEPGDLLEVRIVDVRFRVPYGVNFTNKGVGVLPELLADPVFRIIRLDLERRVALLTPEIEVPLAPFMGIMAVAPPPTYKASARARPAHSAGISISSSSPGARPSTFRCTTPAPCSSPATRTPLKATAKWTAPRSKRRSPRCCSFTCTRPGARA